MITSESTERKPAAVSWLQSGGKMGQFIESMDWSKTPLGPIESWPQSLRTTISLCLASNFPISLAWGPKHTQIYNDGYWLICAGKHPGAMGQDFKECWASAWPAIGEAFESALAGQTRFLENQRMFLDRNGYLEETFFTFSFSPIRDETGGIGGLFHPVTETTSKMLSERRTRALRDLAARTGKAQTTAEVFSLVAQTLGGCELDVPFGLLYSVEKSGNEARLLESIGLTAGGRANPAILATGADGPWPLAAVMAGSASIQVDDLEERFGPLICGPYPEAVKSALLLPITPPGYERPTEILIAGVSSRLPLNDMYRSFYEQMAAAITAAVANARAHEEQHKRAEILAELDRAKTAFFSNVSHEFRTPLTLMLGPLEEARNEPGMRDEQRERLEIAHRNSMRLLKLVNTLLEFSRLESGRIEAVYEPTDLSALTADLASVFRSAIEKAGLKFIVACPALSEPAYVDRDMWEKIILNLLSNAFKFTMRGTIAIRQAIVGDRIEVAVEDTGAGIPADQLEKVFKRFHRVEGVQGRTHEGTGIGLALVQELAKFHGGTVRVQSVHGSGSTFTVSIPLGKSHLPAERIGVGRSAESSSIRADAFVEETLHWIGKEGASAAEAAAKTAETRSGSRGRVLLADDNADMREYVRKLLAPQYEVVTAVDGEAALSAIRDRAPDLVLSDVMMPRLDGFGLVAKLRADAKTAAIPIILLSARAGEESRLEGLEAGADDYLIKPFSSRELLARVAANLELARMRRHTATREQEARDAEKLLEAERDAHRAKDEFLAVLSHELRTPLTPVLLLVSMLEHDQHLPEHVHEDLRTIREHVEIEVRLINDLLDMTKIVRGKLTMDWRDADVHDLLRRVVDGLKTRSSVPIRLELNASRCQVRCDPTRLRQVFWNLLDNAQKYTESTGTITVRTSDAGPERISIEVEDNGMGIDASVLPKLFTAFEQGEIRASRQQAGLGLGLAIAKNLVEAQNGTITAQSAGRGKGAKFTVVLAAAERVAPAAAAPVEAAPAKGPQLRVLVVEDHQPTLEMLSRLLRLMGHQVTGALTVAAAVAAARHERFDLLLSDLGLPDGNGLDLMRQLKHQFVRRGIALTGYGTSEDIRNTKEAGFAAHLTKPVDLVRLEATISEVIAPGAAA